MTSELPTECRTRSVRSERGPKRLALLLGALVGVVVVAVLA